MVVSGEGVGRMTGDERGGLTAGVAASGIAVDEVEERSAIAVSQSGSDTMLVC